MKILFLLITLVCIAQQSCPGHGHDQTNLVNLQNNKQAADLQTTEPTIYSMTILKPEPGQIANGTVEMVQVGDVTNIKATVYSLTPGLHGLHIHQFGNLITGCTSAGPHYNPFNVDHAGPNDSVRHVGDCGNIVMEEGGNVTYLTLQSNLIKLSGETSVIGRAYVLHADEDDLGRGGYSDSKTTGHAGARVACGTIGLSGPFEHWF